MPRSWSFEILGAPPRWEWGFQGPAFHALLFDLLGVKDPALASRIHALPGSKPFSTLGPSRGPGGQVVWTVRVFDPELEARFDGWFDRLLLPVRVLGEAVTLRAIATPEASWTWGERARLIETIAPVEALRLDFVSPTLFRVSGEDLSWPETRLVLRSWQQRWRQASPVSLDFQDPDALAAGIVWSDYRLEARRLHGGHVQGKGAVGHVEWRIRSSFPEAWKREIHWLATWGSWVGTGAKTAHGLGQTRFTPIGAGVSSGREEASGYEAGLRLVVGATG